MPSRSRLAGGAVLLVAGASVAVKLIQTAGSFAPGFHKAAPYQTPPNRMPPGIQPAGSHPQLGGDASPVTMGFAATDVESARAALERSVTGAVSPSDSGYHKAAPYQTPPNRMPPGIQPAGSHPQLGGTGAVSAASPVTMQFSASPTAVAASSTDSGYHKAAPYQTPPNRMPPGIQPAGSHPQLENAGKEPAASPVTMQAQASSAADTSAASASDSGYHKPAPYQTPPNRMPPGIQPAGSHPQLQ